MCVEGPTFFMSNHRGPLGMWPRLIEFDRKYPETTFICNASFSFFLNIFGISTVGIDTQRYLSKLNNPSASIKSVLITTLGLITTRNIKIFEGEDVVDEAVKILANGKNVFIFPETVTNNNKGWRSGVGRVCKKVDVNTVHAGFVFIPKPIYEHTKVVLKPVLGSLISNLNMEPLEISHELQRQHELQFGLN